jgi:hypothetical protein
MLRDTLMCQYHDTAKTYFPPLLSIYGKSLSILCHCKNTQQNPNHFLPLLGYKETMTGLSSKREGKGIEKNEGKKMRYESEMKNITFLSSHDRSCANMTYKDGSKHTDLF